MHDVHLILGTISVAPLYQVIVGVLLVVALAGWLVARTIDGGMKKLQQRSEQPDDRRNQRTNSP